MSDGLPYTKNDRPYDRRAEEDLALLYGEQTDNEFTELIDQQMSDDSSEFAALSSEVPFDISDQIELMHEYRSAIRAIQTKFEILDEDARLRLKHNPIHTITSRLKTPTSIIEKLRRRGYPLTTESIRKNIFDVAGVRVVCNYLHDVNEVADLLLSQDDVKLIEREDYIANPKESGYRSLHLVVSIPVYLNGERREVPVEVQIRTIAMDFWATLEHRLRYKNRTVLEANSPQVDNIRQRLIACADQIAAIDQAMQQIEMDIALLFDYQDIDD